MMDTAEAEEKLLPKCAVAEVGPCKLKLSIEVPADKVKGKIEGKYKELNDTMALPGFRKGHAPRNLLERKFGKQVLEEVKYDLLNKSFEEVKDEKKLEPLGEPDIDIEKVELKENAPLSYEITIEVKPNIALKSYTDIAVKKPAVQVTDADLEVQLKELQESRAEWVSADGAAQKNDQIVADFELRSEGKTIDKSENNALVLNERISFYGMVLEDYHKALEGKKVGDVVEYASKLPETWPDKAYAGKPATIVCAVKSVKRRRLPEIDAAFAKAFDMDSVDELKEHWRKRLEREKEKESRETMADQLIDTLIKENDFPLPEGIVKAGTEEAMRRFMTELLMQGANEEQARGAAEKAASESKDKVVRSIRERFILEYVAQKEKIFVTEDQVEERVQQLASKSGKWPHEMRAYLEEQGLMTQMRRHMREEAVREFLLSKAKIQG